MMMSKCFRCHDTGQVKDKKKQKKPCPVCRPKKARRPYLGGKT